MAVRAAKGIDAAKAELTGEAPAPQSQQRERELAEKSLRGRSDVSSREHPNAAKAVAKKIVQDGAKPAAVLVLGKGASVSQLSQAPLLREKANTGELASRLLSELGIYNSGSPREVLAKAQLVYDSINPETLSPSAQRTHAWVKSAIETLRNAPSDAVVAGFSSYKRTEARSAFMQEVEGNLVKTMKLTPKLAVGSRLFDKEADARIYARGVAAADAFSGRLVPNALGQDGYLKMARAEAYVQHSAAEVVDARLALIELADKHFGAKAEVADALSSGRMGSVPDELRRAVARLLSIDAQGREWSSPYYADPNNTPQSAKPLKVANSLSLKVPAAGEPPHTVMVSPTGRQVHVPSELGRQREAEALNKLEAFLKAAPLDAASAPVFRAQLLNAILATHGERSAAAFEQGRWGNLFVGLRDERIAESLAAYLRFVYAEPLKNTAAALKDLDARVKKASDYDAIHRELVQLEEMSALASYIARAKGESNANELTNAAVHVSELKTELERSAR